MAITNKKLADHLAAQQLVAKQGFSGSYRTDEIIFLLNKIEIEPTDVSEKEKLIQSGQKHYSQMISVEKAPSSQHLALFDQALAEGEVRFATEVQQLAQTLDHIFTQAEQKQRIADTQIEQQDQPIVLVSFVRAGVPLGVLLYHALSDLGRPCVHYGISIIRDRGIDFAALETIIALHGVDAIVFVDGWTGKGAISQELERSLGDDSRFIVSNQLFERDMLPLVVLSDLGGCAWLAASADDWLIPSGILGSTVSGLISRSICEGDTLAADKISTENLGQWHGCIEYDHLKSFDTSVDLIERINLLRRELFYSGHAQHVSDATWTSAQRQLQHAQAQGVVQRLAVDHHIQNLNRIKPGIAEATRAILRRVPDLVLLRYADDADTMLLRHLTEVTGTPVQVVGDAIAPYRAVTLIQKLGGD